MKHIKLIPLLIFGFLLSFSFSSFASVMKIEVTTEIDAATYRDPVIGYINGELISVNTDFNGKWTRLINVNDDIINLTDFKLGDDSLNEYMIEYEKTVVPSNGGIIHMQIVDNPDKVVQDNEATLSDDIKEFYRSIEPTESTDAVFIVETTENKTEEIEAVKTKSHNIATVIGCVFLSIFVFGVSLVYILYKRANK